MRSRSRACEGVSLAAHLERRHRLPWCAKLASKVRCVVVRLCGVSAFAWRPLHQSQRHHRRAGSCLRRAQTSERNGQRLSIAFQNRHRHLVHRRHLPDHKNDPRIMHRHGHRSRAWAGPKFRQRRQHTCRRRHPPRLQQVLRKHSERLAKPRATGTRGEKDRSTLKGYNNCGSSTAAAEVRQKMASQ